MTGPVSRREALAMLATAPMLAGPARAAPPAAPRPMEAVFGSPLRGVLSLPPQRCDLDTPLSFALSNVTVRGAAGRTVLSLASLPELMWLGDCSDVVFEDVAFESGAASSRELVFGLVVALGVHLRRIRFVRCSFSVPLAPTNAIHLVFDHGGSAESVHFEDCTIAAAGRMGLEVQNHGNDDARYHDIRWLGGKIANTGLRSGNGMGISLSGYGSDCLIDTTFRNNLFAAIEGAGVSRSTFSARFAEQTRVVDILSFTGERPMRDNVIRGCRTIGPANGNVLLRRQTGLRMTGNDLQLTGAVLARDINASVFENDRYRTGGTYALFVEGASAGNRWSRCTFDNRGARTPFAIMRFMGAGTHDNLVEDALIVRGPGGVESDNLSGAARNVVKAARAATGRSG